MSESTTLVAFELSDADAARAVYKRLREIDDKDDNMRIVDAAYAHKVNKKKVHLEQTGDMGAGRGAVGGGTVGLITGLMIGGPVGALVGAVGIGALSGLYSGLRDSGVPNGFMRKLGKELEPGQTALFVMYTGTAHPSTLDVLKEYNADLLYSSMPEEATQQVRDAIKEHPEVAVVAQEGFDVEIIDDDEDDEAEADVDLIPHDEMAAPVAAAATVAAIAASASEPEPEPIVDPVVEAPIAAAAVVAAASEREPIVEALADPVVEEELPVVAAVVAANATPAPEVIGDDFRKIEGLGPKMAKVLKAAGVTTYQQLANAKENDLRAILSDAGAKAPPSVNTWSEQAYLAYRGDWGKLKVLQDELIGGVRGSDLKAKDDFSKIKGIGPKVQTALVSAGITTYKKLSMMSQTELKDALHVGHMLGGPLMATWPQQAWYASRGDWKGLEELQSQLK
jgi:uncharacterized membrane protein/predicted flap endonuclease-1-like 5' DNA nuclease